MESITWNNSGISFSSAVEAGEFLTSQGFTACNGGFEKRDRLDGGTIYASYVLTLGECFIRFAEAGATIDPDFSQEDIWHAMRMWGCGEAQAKRMLIEEEKRWAEVD